MKKGGNRKVLSNNYSKEGGDYMTKITPLYTDVMFKAVFGSPDSIKFVTYFLSSYFNIPYEELEGNVEILNPEVPTKILKSKKKTLDVILKMNDEKILIEMNCFNKNMVLTRNLVYLMQEYSYQFKKDDNYKDIKRYHQINFCRYSYFEPKVEKAEVKLRDQYGNVYIESIKSDFIDIDYCKKIMYNKTNVSKLDKWILILMSETKEELEKAIGDDMMDKLTKEEFMEIVEDLDKIEEIHEYFEKYEDRSTWDEQEKEIIRKKAEKEGLEEDLKKGIEQGSLERQRTIAKNLLQMNIPIDIIVTSTGLTEEEIAK